jgi:hypothetical protein
MWLIVGVVIVSIAVVIFSRMRVARGVNGSELGWMSEQSGADDATRVGR